MTQLTQHCYLLSGLCAESPWAVNAGFIVGTHTTLVVDTGATDSSARTIFGYAKCAKPENAIIVVNTEPHFDHMGGNSFFLAQGVEIYAHPGLIRTEAEFQRNKADFNRTILNPVRRNAMETEAFHCNTTLANPNRTIVDGYGFELGNLEVFVMETPGHTPLNISIWVPADGVLYCGDTVVTAYMPNLECGGVTDWQTWQQSIETIRNRAPQMVVPGHGPPMVAPEAVETQLDRMQQILETAVQSETAPTGRTE